ncbi:MAG: hypothetical protein H7255_17940 [Ramlibacter sp.]|nr:hypothetical protein [Ramlibacter sp.]
MPFTLNGISTAGDGAITPTETDLDAALTGLGPDSTAADLLKFQGLLSINSVITSTFSGCMKERSDTLKGVVQKF